MIHWGSDVPTQLGAVASSCSIDEERDSIDVKPLKSNKFWAQSSRPAYSLSLLDLGAYCNEHSGSGVEDGNNLPDKCASLRSLNVVTSMWLNKRDITKAKAYVNGLARDVVDRLRSKSLHDFRTPMLSIDSKILLDIDASPSLHDGQDFVVYLSVVNTAPLRLNIEVTLAVDTASRNLRTCCKVLSVEEGTSEQVCVRLSSTEVWQVLKRDEKALTVTATAKDVDSMDKSVLTKYEQTRLYWRKQTLATKARHLFANYRPVTC